MNKLIRVIALSWGLAFMLNGCGMKANGPNFQFGAYAPDLATIYLYRPLAKNDRYLLGNIAINHQKLFYLASGGYAELRLQPGHYLIESYNAYPPTVDDFMKVKDVNPTEQERLMIEVKAGQTYFIRWQSVVDHYEERPIPYVNTVGMTTTQAVVNSMMMAAITSQPLPVYDGSLQFMETGIARSEVQKCKKVFPNDKPVAGTFEYSSQ